MNEAVIEKAYARLKEFSLFSQEYESFKQLFYSNLKDEKAAIEVLLMVVFRLLKSDGERFGELLASLGEEKRGSLLKWLDESLRSLS